MENDHPEGMSVQQIVEIYTAQGDRLTEATFRKYVQLGLLPRSRRVGRKGKHQGSRGLYPATALRQLVRIRQLMAQGFTIEQIQKEFLFVRGDIEVLSRQMSRVYEAFESALGERVEEGESVMLSMESSLKEAQQTGEELIAKLEAIEAKITMHARMARASV